MPSAPRLDGYAWIVRQLLLLAELPWVRILFALLLLTAPGLAYLDKVREIDAQWFSQSACLEATAKWSYGYVYTQHGAVLAKARNPVLGVPISEECGDSGIAPIMARELRELPMRAVGELAFYLLVIAWWFWGAQGLHAGLRIAQRRRAWRLAFGAFSWVVPWSILLLPLLTTGYGNPLFGDLVGPGALSVTTAEGTTPTWGKAVSYSAFVGGAAMLPILLWEGIRQVAPLPEITTTAGIWLAGVLLWGALGVLRELVDGRRRR